MKQINSDDLQFDGTLSVWHIPQVPGEPFRVEVATPLEGRLLMDLLADYDAFQYARNVKLDYSNVNGLDVYEGGEWVTWYDEDGNDIDEMTVINGHLIIKEDW